MGKATLRWAVARADDAPLKDALVWLTPSTALLEHGEDGYRTILPDPVKARVRDGVMSVEVFATDDPAFQPVGWAWQVHLVAPNGPNPFYVYAPGGVVTDVAGVAPVLAPDGDWVVKGEPGEPGKDGHTPVIEWAGTALSIDGAVGPDLKGVPGKPGEPGMDGESGKITRVTVDTLLADAPFYIAHRGSGDVFPEHTMDAYMGSLSAGAKAIEVSVMLTADNVPVCFHDSTLDRATGVSGSVADYTLSELRTLTTDFRKFLGPNTTRPGISTLEEVLDRIAGKAVIFLEAKVGVAQPYILKAIKDHGMEDSVVVKMHRNGIGNFNGEAGFAAEAKALGLTTWCYVAATDSMEDITRLVTGSAVDMVGVPHYENLPRAGGSSMTDEQIRAVVALGKPVICWEVHRRSVRDRMVANGVRGMMCSNYTWVATPEKFTSTTVDPRRGVRRPGELPGGDQIPDNMPAWNTSHGWLVMNQRSDSSFHLSSLSNHTMDSYTLSVTMGWPSGAPTVDSFHAGVVFAAESDEAWGFSTKHADATGGSYMLIWRGAGRVMLMKYDPGATSGKSLGQITAGPVPADGKFQTFNITVSPTGITVTLDGVPDTITTTDSTYRGKYVHLVKNHLSISAGDFALSKATVAPAV